MIFWDFVAKNKIKSVKEVGSYTASKLSPDGLVLAYGIGNDWHKGMESLSKMENKVGAYVIPDLELSYKA